MEWLQRLDTDGVYQTARPPIITTLLGVDDDGHQTRAARYGDFSKMNQQWNSAKSATTHARLRESAEEWQHYHALYREARKTWAVVPF